MAMPTPHQALEKYFGYTSFRPLQEAIIRNILEQKDAFILMPTGGGKSLCYQLPSTLLTGTTIVISPLISLMKDQVDALKQNGITAAYLNSSLSQDEQANVIADFQKQKLRLLYVAPERLVQEQFLQLLQNSPINFFAIDEAHCISQWGHDFRPEYRQLNMLRTRFPDTAVVALTATATERVKQDILSHLTLRNPAKYQASFNRPNLQYFVYPKSDAFKMVLSYIREHENESGIIYCQSRKTVDHISRKLQEKGIKALPYHAGLDANERKRNQEAFIKDDVQIVIATIAFGMGIDKPNVRYVIHYDLPKSLEGYYQETGRAGRDGLPSTCIFLFSIGDKYFYDRFIQEKSDPQEQRIAKQHLQTVITYAQSRVCRRVQLLKYFGETFSAADCNACDNCLTPREMFDGTEIAQKILSCIYRVHERFGTSHIADILTGSQAKKIIERKHHLLSTYNLLAEYSSDEVKMFIYELIQLGYIQQTDDQYALLSLTPKSARVLKKQEPVMLTKPEPITLATDGITESTPADQELFSQLRALRKRIADERSVPPYVIFSDRSLQVMATVFPQTKMQFAQIHGVGEQKLEELADTFLTEIIAYCSVHNIQADPAKLPVKAKKRKTRKSNGDTVTETLTFFHAGKPIQQIALERGMSEQTITRHLQQAYIQGELIDLDNFVTKAKQIKIKEAFAEHGMQYLSPIKEKLGDTYSYDEIRWVQAYLIKNNI
jgi:ATP-dependent DNA helicase RecQ